MAGRIAVAVGLPVILAACTPAASPGNSAGGVPVPPGRTATPTVSPGWTAAVPVPGLAGLGPTPATCVAVGLASSVHVPGAGFTAAMT